MILPKSVYLIDQVLTNVFHLILIKSYCQASKLTCPGLFLTILRGIGSPPRALITRLVISTSFYPNDFPNSSLEILSKGSV